MISFPFPFLLPESVERGNANAGLIFWSMTVGMRDCRRRWSASSFMARTAVSSSGSSGMGDGAEWRCRECCG